MVIPTARRIAPARSRWLESTFSFAKSAVAPQPTSAGVLGIVLTIAMSPPAQPLMCASRTPAAIDTRSGRCVRSTGARSCTTVCMICGLTASTSVAHRDATSSLSLPALIPNCRATSSSFDVSGSNTQIVPGGVPLATNPPMRLAPMLPPPMNPMFESLIPATFRPEPFRATHYRVSGRHRKPPFASAGSRLQVRDRTGIGAHGDVPPDRRSAPVATVCAPLLTADRISRLRPERWWLLPPPPPRGHRTFPSTGYRVHTPGH